MYVRVLQVNNGLVLEFKIIFYKLVPKCPGSELRSVLGPKCPWSEVSVHHVSGYISAVHYGDTWNDEQTHKMGRSNIVARYYPSNPNANSEETLDRD